MTNADETFEEEYSEYDEFDDEEEGGLSGFSVLVIGLVMFGAFIAITWIAYHQGLKRGENGVGTPYVAADPEPIKIESADARAPVEDREVYDVFDGETSEPATVLAEGPEEPVDRGGEDPIAAIAAGASAIEQTDPDVSEQAEARIADLEVEDASAFDETSAAVEAGATPAPVTATEPTPVRTAAVDAAALSGSHLVQVGAFRSDAEARAQWSRIQTKLGDFVAGKSIDVETADLGDRGVYHRLRLGPFASADAAKEYCAGLKERGQDCLIKAK